MKKMLSSMFLLIMGLTLLGCDPPLDEDGDIVITAGEEVTVEVYSKSILGATCKLDDCEIRYEPTDVDFNNVGEYVIYYEAFVNDEYEKYAIQFVNVVDTTPPVCSSLEHQTLTLGEEHVFPEPVCEDNYSFVEIIPEEHIDMTTPGDYYIDYICKDTSGNETVVTWTFTLEEVVLGEVSIPTVENTFDIQEIAIDSTEYSLYLISDDIHIAGSTLLSYDIDVDGDDDIIYTDGTGDAIAYLRNDQSSFSKVFIDNISSTGYFEFIDLDGDMVDELMVSSYYDDGFYIYKNQDLTFYSTFLKTEGDHPRRIVALDIDLDGDEDLIHFEWDQNSIAIYDNNDGILALESYFSTSTSDEVVQQIETIEFDYGNDGDLDLIVANANGLTGELYILENDNGELKKILIDNIRAQDPLLADLDHDGDLDLLVIASNKFLYTFENVNGEFINRTMIFSDMFDGTSMVIVEEDNVFEVIIPTRESVAVLKNFSLTSATPLIVDIEHTIYKDNAALIDVNNDGVLDVFYSTINDAYVFVR